jgi:hypothetical protein
MGKGYTERRVVVKKNQVLGLLVPSLDTERRGTERARGALESLPDGGHVNLPAATALKRSDSGGSCRRPL